MSSPKFNGKVELDSNAVQDVKKLLNKFFSNANKSEFKMYQELIFKLNDELFKDGQINPHYINKHQFDLKEMKEYLDLIKDILDNKKIKN